MEGDLSSRSLRRIEHARYEVSADVVHVRADWWVIDAGILLFRHEPPPKEMRQGCWVQGTIEVGVDPFFYFESLALQSDAPALIYDWSIEKLEMQTAPFVETQPRVLVRDPAQLAWKEIRNTNAWEDDGGHAEYILHCRRVGAAARRNR